MDQFFSGISSPTEVKSLFEVDSLGLSLWGLVYRPSMSHYLCGHCPKEIPPAGFQPREYHPLYIICYIE
jgi:hypothetical protein